MKRFDHHDLKPSYSTTKKLGLNCTCKPFLFLRYFSLPLTLLPEGECIFSFHLHAFQLFFSSPYHCFPYLFSLLQAIHFPTLLEEEKIYFFTSFLYNITILYDIIGLHNWFLSESVKKLCAKLFVICLRNHILSYCMQLFTSIVNNSFFLTDALNQIYHKCRTKSLLSSSRFSLQTNKLKPLWKV